MSWLSGSVPWSAAAWRLSSQLPLGPCPVRHVQSTAEHTTSLPPPKLLLRLSAAWWWLLGSVVVKWFSSVECCSLAAVQSTSVGPVQSTAGYTTSLPLSKPLLRFSAAWWWLLGSVVVKWFSSVECCSLAAVQSTSAGSVHVPHRARAIHSRMHNNLAACSTC